MLGVAQPLGTHTVPVEGSSACPRQSPGNGFHFPECDLQLLLSDPEQEVTGFLLHCLTRHLLSLRPQSSHPLNRLVILNCERGPLFMC